MGKWIRFTDSEQRILYEVRDLEHRISVIEHKLGINIEQTDDIREELIVNNGRIEIIDNELKDQQIQIDAKQTRHKSLLRRFINWIGL